MRLLQYLVCRQFHSHVTSYLTSHIHSLTLVMKVYRTVSEDLLSFGYRLCTEIDCLGRKAELEPPKLRYKYGNQEEPVNRSDIHTCH